MAGRVCAGCGAPMADDGEAEATCLGCRATISPGPGPETARPDRAVSTRAAPPEETVFGRYRLLGRLGAGGMGVVWKARDTVLDRVVALKQVRGFEEAEAAEVRVRFLREARLAARLRHPRIVPIWDVGEVGSHPYLTMEYVAGGTLAGLLATRRAARLRGERESLAGLPEEVAVLAEVAGAVAFAHREGVIHRDLKPGNVLLDEGGRAYVTDFGLAKDLRAEVEDAARLTRTGELLGTPAYMSPEQAEGVPERVGPAADVWALGAMLYECLTGEPPFLRAGRTWDVLRAVATEDPEPPRRRNPHAPEELEAVCLKALERDPANRTASAGAVEEDLRRWLRGDPVTARPPGPARRLLRRVARHRWAVGATCALLVLGALAGTGWWIAAGARSDAAAMREEALRGLRDLARLCVGEALAARRAGDPAAGRRLLPRLLEAHRRTLERLPTRSAEPDYLVGRYMRLLGSDRLAIQRQESALAIDPGFAPALYERAVLAARSYRAEVEELRGARRLAEAVAPVDPVREAVAGDAPAQARDRVIEWLDRLQAELAREPGWGSHPEELLRVGPAQIGCVQGMRAAYGGAGWESARRALEAAIAGDPSREEAHEALVEAALAERRWDDAIAAAGRALEADRGYLPHWMNRGNAHWEKATELVGRDADAGEPAAAAVADFDRALALDPECADAWRARGGVRVALGFQRMRRGLDPAESLTPALADIDAAQRLHPKIAQGWIVRALVGLTWGAYRAARGEDAIPVLETAVADAGRAIELAPESASACRTRGLARAELAAARLDAGGDAAKECDAALADLDRALALAPGDLAVRVGRGRARGCRALAGMRSGEDPRALLAEAIRDLEAVLVSDPERSDARAWLDGARGLLRQAEEAVGK